MLLDAVAARVGRLVARRAGLLILITLIVSAGAGFALAFIPSHPSADSFQGDSSAVRAEKRIDDNLPPAGFAVPFVVSGAAAVDGNVLSRAAFDEILAREAVLRADPTVTPFVFGYVDPHLQTEVSSVWALPDTLRAFMDNKTPLTYALGWHEAVGGPGVGYDEADDAQWQDALSRLFAFATGDGNAPFLRIVSADVEREGGVWRARTMFVVPALDRETFFDAYADDPAEATAGTPYFETMQLHVRDTLRSDTAATRWVGLGIGINTEVEREVAESGRLVAVSFLIIGALLLLVMRNLRDFLVGYASLPLLIVWMLGAARVLGLSSNQFTAMLPVLILVLGIDYAIHGVRRYREERGAFGPKDAVLRSFSLGGPALLLAALTTAVAFFSNGFSRVEALRDWGIEGGIAILAALWLCGVFSPALRHAWDRWRVRRGVLPEAPRPSRVSARVREGTLLGRLAAGSAARPLLVLGLVLVVTVPAGIAASFITSDFDANDFLDADSELIRGVTIVERDFPDEGEPALLLVEGDVAEPAVLHALDAGFSAFEARGYRHERDFSLVRVVKVAMEFPEENVPGLPDADGDRIPDTAAALRSLYAHILREGVYARLTVPPPPPPDVLGVPVPDPLLPSPPPPQRVLVYSADTVRELVHPDPEGGYDMTVVYFGIPGTGSFASIPAAEAALRESATDLWALLDDGTLERITFTGEPFKRYEMVEAITDSLQISITLSIVLCFLLVFAVFRSLPYAIVTTLPVIVLVVWLFAFMVAVGLSLNLVTVTVAAMSIGVGIDYSIHVTERFREEIRGGQRPIDAIRRSMDSSGIAMLGSAATTVAGFLVLVFAPMPLFATFGFITAVMAAASFLASATILPPLLVLLADRPPPSRRLAVDPGKGPSGTPGSAF